MLLTEVLRGDQGDAFGLFRGLGLQENRVVALLTALLAVAAIHIIAMNVVHRNEMWVRVVPKSRQKDGKLECFNCSQPDCIIAKTRLRLSTYHW